MGITKYGLDGNNGDGNQEKLKTKFKSFKIGIIKYLKRFFLKLLNN
jgi:hypothetical protein